MLLNQIAKNDWFDKNDNLYLLLLLSNVIIILWSFQSFLDCLSMNVRLAIFNILSYLISCLISYVTDIISMTIKMRIAITRLMIVPFVIPIIEILTPVQSLQTKFDKIMEDYRKNNFDNLKNQIDITDEFSKYGMMTQPIWNTYVLKLQKINKSDYDLFDTMIFQKLTQINFVMTITINRSESSGILYAEFYKKLHSVLGEAVDIKYRYTQNKTFYVSIFGDQSNYRRFALVDII